MRDEVLRILSQVLNVPTEQLDDDCSPDTVANWDSLKQMNLILALEEEFGATFPDDEVVKMLSVRRIVEILENKKSKGNIASQ